ncbi:MAG: signal peptidase I [Oscillospiraceae bacterium]|nr:signal peptidase I [Oscillospiraceae bacterium]
MSDHKKKRELVLPTEEEVQAERRRLKFRRRFIATLRTTVYALIVVAAVAVLLATLFLPVLQVSGSSMEPTLSNNDIILLFKTDKLETGDLIGFYYQNKLLLKRVIGVAGDTIDIDEEGNVTVNGELIDEPYVTNKSIGECDIDLPYQVPENRVFVMGDNRTTSIDSRSSAIGCIEEDQIVGKVLMRIYPFNKITIID